MKLVGNISRIGAADSSASRFIKMRAATAPISSASLNTTLTGGSINRNSSNSSQITIDMSRPGRNLRSFMAARRAIPS